MPNWGGGCADSGDGTTPPEETTATAADATDEGATAQADEEPTETG